MSYILDALRKADAQRERDPARGIHARPVASAPDSPAGRQTRLWLWGTVGLVSAGLLAVAAWQLARPAATVMAPPAVAPTPATVPLLPPVAAAAVAPAVPLPPPAAQVLPPAPPAAPPPPAAVTAPVREAAGAAPATALATSASTTAEPGRERVLSVSELPADVQRELPKLAISGGVYSANPAQRMLIVNGQVLGEGADAAPGVRLEQIRAKTAVLSYRGYRYGLAY